jgi:hypothetical protein
MMGRPNMVVPKDLQKDGDIGKRDGERIPISWDGSPQGGFSTAEPDKLWLPTADAEVNRDDNLELQAKDPNSPYRVVKEVLLRRLNDEALHEGGLRLLHTDNPDVLAFARTDPTDKRRQVISLTNFTQDTVTVSVLDAGQTRGKITMTSSQGRQRGDEEVDFERPITLSPDESYLIDSIA